MQLYDSIKNFWNGLANTRNALSQNHVTASCVDYEQLRAIYRSGLGNKIVRIKSGYALNDTLVFETTREQEIYDERFADSVIQAVQWMLAFGRGIIVLYESGDDLALPHRGEFNPNTVRFKVFGGDMVTAVSPSLDLMSERYYKPEYYSVRGRQFHHGRVIDFAYVEPPEQDKPEYQYGGISEFELVYSQIIADGIVERATPSILEKNSTLFYKVKGFKQAIADKRHSDMLSYYSQMENGRSIYGAGLIDADDEAFAVNQTLTNLADADMITLRRLSMVTGIPLAILVGENVKGLNSTGDNELRSFQEGTIEPLERRYILPRVAELFRKLGLNPPALRENQGRSPEDKIKYESEALDNALKLWQMGEDYNQYLLDRDVIQRDSWSEFFEGETDQEPELPPMSLEQLMSNQDA